MRSGRTCTVAPRSQAASVPPGPRSASRRRRPRTTRPAPSVRSSAAPWPRTSSSRQRRPSTSTSGCGTSVPASRRPARPRRSISGPPAAAASGCRSPAAPPPGSGGRRPAPPGGRRRPARPPPVISRPSSSATPDQRAGVRLPLGLVAVEQGVGRLPRQHRGQLPGQLVHVAQAEPQPLPDERRGQVRGVAGQQHPARPATGRPPARGTCTRRPARSPAPAGSTGASSAASRSGSGQLGRGLPRPPAGTPSGTGRR